MNICCGCGQLTHCGNWAGSSLSPHPGVGPEVREGSGLQLPAAMVTTAGVDPAGVRAEGMQQEPPPDENKVRQQLPPGEGWWN